MLGTRLHWNRLPGTIRSKGKNVLPDNGPSGSQMQNATIEMSELCYAFD